MRIFNAICIAGLSLTVILLSGCNSTKSISTDSKTVVSNDIAYGPSDAQTLDVYAPSDANNAPIIFMVHGGAWRFGDKATGAVVENKVSRWVEMGFVFVSVNYRLLPEAGPREQVAQCLSQS